MMKRYYFVYLENAEEKYLLISEDEYLNLFYKRKEDIIDYFRKEYSSRYGIIKCIYNKLQFNCNNNLITLCRLDKSINLL